MYLQSFIMRISKIGNSENMIGLKESLKRQTFEKK